MTNERPGSGTSADDRCKFGDRCDWPHLHLSEDSHICWTCGNIYPSKSDLAIHRKNIHKNAGLCKYFGSPGGCKRGDEGCHYFHIKNQSHFDEAHEAAPHSTQTQSRPDGAHGGGAPSNQSRPDEALEESEPNEAHAGTHQGFQKAPLNTTPPNPTSKPMASNPMILLIKEFMNLQQQLNQQFLGRLEQ